LVVIRHRSFRPVRAISRITRMQAKPASTCHLTPDEWPRIPTVYYRTPIAERWVCRFVLTRQMNLNELTSLYEKEYI
jgi:hypothetical protein